MYPANASESRVPSVSPVTNGWAMIASKIGAISDHNVVDHESGYVGPMRGATLMPASFRDEYSTARVNTDDHTELPAGG